MPTDLQNLIARKSAVIAQLAGLASGSPGYGPTYDVDGQKVNHMEYRKSLYEELGMLNLQISIAQGPFEERAEAIT